MNKKSCIIAVVIVSDPICDVLIYFMEILFQEIESQLERPGVSYEARVSAALSGWERLAGFVHGDVNQMQPLATYLYR